jgi:eukaryotic-like serine/threonine-protein kinase
MTRETANPTGGWRPPPSALRRGRTVGKYVLTELIGAGAMGTVYRAMDPDLQRDVAIKLMSPAVASDVAQRNRFLREARAAGSLHHPSIITVYGFGEVDGELYIAMEFVEGRDLSGVIRNHEELSLADKIDILLDVLSALTYAHDRRITHRDIKPGNIRLDTNGKARIMDFGVAHLAESDLTNSGLVLGTPNYIAPEQLRGAEPTPAGDIFSVGAVFFELLAYQKPFDGDTAHAVMYNVASDEPVSLKGLHQSVPGSVRRVLRKSMAKDPGLRYRSAAEMARDLQGARNSLTAEEADATVVLATNRRSRARSRRRTSPRHLAVLGTAMLTTAWVVGARGTNVAPASQVLEPDTLAVMLGFPPNEDSAAARAPERPDSLLNAVRDAALAERLGAEKSGVPSELLAAGDERVAAADSLIEAGRYSQAILAFSSASSKWALAVDQHHRERAAAAQVVRRRPPATSRPAPTQAATSTQTSPVPVRPPAEAHRAVITALVDRLESAMESRSTDRLRSTYPNLSQREREMWSRFFDSAGDLEMTLAIDDLEISGDFADARIKGVYSYVTAKGRQQHAMELTATFERTGGVWRISSLGSRRDDGS